jgi:hypothetical protein
MILSLSKNPKISSHVTQSLKNAFLSLRIRTIKTDHFDKAAFFTSFGAKLTELNGHYPDNGFVLQVPHWLLLYERTIGLVSYRKFCHQRIRLKRRGRRAAGLPEKFTGSDRKHGGFRLGDIVHLRYDKRLQPETE